MRIGRPLGTIILLIATAYRDAFGCCGEEMDVFLAGTQYRWVAQNDLPRLYSAHYRSHTDRKGQHDASGSDVVMLFESRHRDTRLTIAGCRGCAAVEPSGFHPMYHLPQPWGHSIERRRQL